MLPTQLGAAKMSDSESDCEGELHHPHDGDGGDCPVAVSFSTPRAARVFLLLEVYGWHECTVVSYG